MNHYVLRRLAAIPFVLLLANFAGFAYAHLARPVQLANNPMIAMTGQPSPLFPAYARYLRGLLWGGFGGLPQVGAATSAVIAKATVATLGLLSLALVISILLGIALGIAAVRTRPTRIAPWLTALTTVALAMPGFYIGSLLILAVLFYLIHGPANVSMPVQGFGWDRHLILPVLVLAARPTAQVAQVTAALLASEMERQYVVTALSVGVPIRVVRRKHALVNAMAPIFISLFTALRLAISELIVVEWIFAWPGIGRLLALSLLAPRTGGMPDRAFLDPATLATTLTVFAAILLFGDLLAGAAARLIDPRLRNEVNRAEDLAHENA